MLCSTLTSPPSLPYHPPPPLPLSPRPPSAPDEYTTKVFKEADYDYSQGIDYNEFLDAFTQNRGSRFMPEFLKPKTLRSSTLAAPWECRQHTQPTYITSAIGSSGFDRSSPSHFDGVDHNPPPGIDPQEL